MKIVKRDGRTVDYDSEKIRIAINKANNEVSEQNKVSDKEITAIISYIESLGKKRMLVEDIQDIIEEKLMEKKKYVLAKIYIIYRYKRSIIRQSNTIDASILSLLKNGSGYGNKYLDANRQRDVMAGEVSKDLAYRLLLPPNVVEAEKNGRIKFCNVEYFTEPVIESSKIDLADMYENGTVINDIEIDPPKSFQSACNILVEIVASVASAQTGDIYIDFKDLYRYYYMTFDKLYSMYSSLMKSSLTEEQIKAMANTQSFLEVRTGIQTILYQINTITIGSGLVPKVHFLIDPKEIRTDEEERIVFEFVKQRSEGIKDGSGNIKYPDYPNIVYVLPNDGILQKKYEYITSEFLDSKCQFTVMNEKRFDDFKKDISKLNQGSMAINLVKIAYDSLASEKDFESVLKESLDCCYEGFLCRNHNLQGVFSDKSPIHWRYGAIARLGFMERIDHYLKKDRSRMTLKVCGFEAACKILRTDDFIKKSICDIVQNAVKNWNKDNPFDVIISNEVDSSFDVSDYKKYNITDLNDSIEFMKSNYFKTGLLFAKYTSSQLDHSSIYENDFIFKKSTFTDD